MSRFLNIFIIAFVAFFASQFSVHGQSESESVDRVTFAFGNNDKNQLATVRTHLPFALNRITSDADVSLNSNIFITSSKTLNTFGSNSDGQLGTGDTSDIDGYRPVAFTGSDTELVKVAAGSSHTLVLTASGQLWSSGSNDQGQLGSASAPSTSEFVNTENDLSNPDDIKTFTARGDTSFVLYDNGELFAWGANDNTLYGSQDNDVPRSVDQNIDSIAAGLSHLLRLSDGAVFSSGSNDQGQLGIADSDGSKSRVNSGDLEDQTVTVIGAGHRTSFAVTESGRLCAWGNNRGQLGLGSGQSSGSVTSPTMIDVDALLLNSEEKVTQIVGGAEHTLILTSENRLFAAGSNEYGQLGNGTDITDQTEEFVLINTDYDLSDDPIVKIAAGEYTSMALTESGTLLLWGRREYLGVPSGLQLIPQEVVAPNTRFSSVFARHKMSFAFTEHNGYLYSWGDNAGQALVRDSSMSTVSLPERVREFPNLNVTAFGVGGSPASGATFWIASSAEKNYLWGSNSKGQLAAEGETFLTTPTAADTHFASELRSISLGLEFTVVVTNTRRRVEGSGGNSKGQLGRSLEKRETPLLLLSPTSSDSAVGDYHTLIIANSLDGSEPDRNFLYAAGSNEFGQLAENETMSSRSAFDTISLFDKDTNTEEEPVRCFAGPHSSFAITSSGHLYAWGDNQYGQLGVANSTENNDNDNDVVVRTPQRVQLPDGAKAFRVASYHHTLVVTEDGKLFGFGRNQYGQLGTGDQENRRSPVEINLGIRALDVAVGSQHSLVIAGRRSCIDNCNENGLCDFMVGVCQCDEGFFGDFCEFKECPQNCNSDLEQGTCDVTTGICDCVEPYQGDGCEYLRCPGDCNGNGACNTATGVCQCFDGFTGADCEGSGAASMSVSVVLFLVSTLFVAVMTL